MRLFLIARIRAVQTLMMNSVGHLLCVGSATKVQRSSEGELAVVKPVAMGASRNRA
jgi:hypothetical protein